MVDKLFPLLLLPLLLGADAGTPWPREGVPVYRSRAELPKQWASVVPDDFDFDKEMLAGVTEGAMRVRVTEPSAVLRDGQRLLVIPKAVRRQCPPCRGIEVNSVDEWAGASSRHPQLDYEQTPVYRVPRTKGKVYVAPMSEETCPVCGKK